MSDKSFDPTRYLRKLGKGDYLEVKYRLLWFRTEHPDGQVATQLLQLDLEKRFALFRAVARYPVYERDGDGMALVARLSEGGEEAVRTWAEAVGHGSETASDFGDYIEKAECVPLDTEILTQRHGFKRWDQLVIGELVAAYDRETDALTWTPLERVSRFDNAEVVRLHNNTFDVVCTPDHSWAVLDCNKQRVLRKANELRASDRLIIAAKMANPSGRVPVSEWEASVLGWMFTDGTVRRVGNSVRATITQSKPHTVAVLEELLGEYTTVTVTPVSQRTFPSGRTYDCLPQYRFGLSSALTRDLLVRAEVYTDADLPACAARLSSPARAAMLSAMMQADGDRRRYFGKKRRPGTMEAWRILATLEGYAIGQQLMSSVGEVPLQRLKQRRYVCASELTVTPAGTMPVWCPTTRFGTWVAKQNNRAFITGNTKAIGRALAALGYGTQFCDDFDERDNRPADAPVERTAQQQQRPATPQQKPALVRAAEEATGQPARRIPNAPNHTGNGGGPVLPATEPQIRALHAIARNRLQWEDGDLEAHSREVFGAPPSGLSRRQASDLIEWMNKQDPA